MLFMLELFMLELFTAVTAVHKLTCHARVFMLCLLELVLLLLCVCINDTSGHKRALGFELAVACFAVHAFHARAFHARTFHARADHSCA